MTKVVITIFTCLMAYNCQAQKPDIDLSSLGRWPSLFNVKICRNGKFSGYIYTSKDSSKVTNILYVVSNSTGVSKVFKNVFFYDFTNNNEDVVFIKGEDTLCVYNLNDESIHFIPHVRSFRIPKMGVACLYAYLQGKQLIVQNVKGIDTLAGVEDYFFSKDGKILIAKCLDSVGKREKLNWVDVESGYIHPIWTGAQLGQYSYDDIHNHLVFLAKSTLGNEGGYSVYHYKKGMDTSLNLLRGDSALFGGRFLLANHIAGVSKNSDKVLLELLPNGNAKGESGKGDTNLVLWSYNDPILQSQRAGIQSDNIIESKFYWVTLDISQKSLASLDTGDVLIKGMSPFENYFLLSDPGPKEYEPGISRRSIYLVNANNGSKRLIARLRRQDFISVSPDEKYVCWFDPDSLSYYSYNIGSGITQNISKSIPATLYNDKALGIAKGYLTFGRLIWTRGGHTLILFDRYDLWRIDLGEEKHVVNLTNQFGAKHRIIFDIVESYGDYPVRYVDIGGKILLNGFDPTNKMNGFWWMNTTGGDPEECIMGNYAYMVGRTGSVGYNDPASGFAPVKALDANVYIVGRKSAKEFRNFFVSKDLKTFTPISDVHPEQKYNWLTAELVTWKMLDGRLSQGILYKPENFDSTKKYPLIFDVYEKKSDGLNEYIDPAYSGGRINISYFVSNGYLVFRPDIYYESGHKGKSVFNALESAAIYFSHMPWVDSTRLGLQGHSFGGWEVNYMVTHSRRFAAASAADGVSDEVSAYDAVNNIGSGGLQDYYETGGQASPYGFGVTPWTNPELYVENSPVFFVDSAFTPLLISHGDVDATVPFAQGEEMFLAMRRAGKKVWMLQYHGAGHSVNDKDAEDFTVRMKEFFDYYLKGAPPPKWMTQGVPAAEAKYDSGLELDLSGRIP